MDAKSQVKPGGKREYPSLMLGHQIAEEAKTSLLLLKLRRSKLLSFDAGLVCSTHFQTHPIAWEQCSFTILPAFNPYHWLHPSYTRRSLFLLATGRKEKKNISWGKY